MPIHEYECQQCKTRFERLEWKQDEAPPPCPSCGAQTKKAISAPGAFILKGDGFYATEKHRGETCCGQEGGCDTPKKCCGQ